MDQTIEGYNLADEDDEFKILDTTNNWTRGDDQSKEDMRWLNKMINNVELAIFRRID